MSVSCVPGYAVGTLTLIVLCDPHNNSVKSLPHEKTEEKIGVIQI